MSVVFKLMGFGLRQVLAETGNVAAGAVEKVVEHLWTDHSQTLPKALARANDRAEQAVSIALAGDGFQEQVRVFFASADDKGIRRQVQQFLAAQGDAFPGATQEFRQACLAELKQARQGGHLTLGKVSARDLARHAAAWPRYANPGALITGTHQAVAQVADELAAPFPNLAGLLRLGVPGEPPLLASAFSFFFRREVETDAELARGLTFDQLQKLTASQQASFAAVGAALDTLGGKFDQLFSQLDRLEAGVLDLQAEMQRLPGVSEIRQCFQEVISRLDRAGLSRGAVQPRHSLSIRSDGERQAVKQLLERYRRLSAQEQAQVPAMLNAIGQLQMCAGDFAGAGQTFGRVTQLVADPAAQAQAHYNAYRAALEQQRWDDALREILQAARLSPQCFSPFPLNQYEPKRILGAGGFGTVFHCFDRKRQKELVIKTLHDADLERGPESVFQEGYLLRELRHPAIIGVLAGGYADKTNQARPYLVMDYFPGVTLEHFVEERGPLSPDQLVQVARQIAAGILEAHGQQVLHRDLKPANVLVRKLGLEWQVKIIDFGLALRRSTVETSQAVQGAGETMLTRSVAGTIKYGPPEQMGDLSGVPPGPYSDVYSFGKMCCWALFEDTEPKSRHLSALPKELAKLLEDCTERDPKFRPAGFDVVLRDLDQLTGAPPKSADAGQRVPSQPAVPEPVASPVTEPVQPAASLLVAIPVVEPVRPQQPSITEGPSRSLRTPQKSTVQTPTGPGGRARPVIAAAVLVSFFGVLTLSCVLSLAWYQPWKGTKVEGPKPDLVASTESPVGVSLPAKAPVLVNLPANPKPGQIWTNSLGMKFAWIPPGEFTMGSPPGEFTMGSPPGAQGRSNNETPHTVKITRGFWMGVYEVTQGQWRSVTGDNPSHFKGDDNRPVESVDWDQCKNFCQSLTQKMQDGKTYRLPTEAEWEYACRAGTTTAYHSGNGEAALQQVGWYSGNGSNQTTRPVGLKDKNAWGLYDMHGNVWEWCADWCGDYPNGYIEDPKGSNSGASRVLRGGSWRDSPRDCRSAYRLWLDPGSRIRDIGLRVCFRVTNTERPVVVSPPANPKPRTKDTADDTKAPVVISLPSDSKPRTKDTADDTKAPGGVSLPANPKPGQIWTNSLGMKFAWIPPGEFTMGSPPDEDGRLDNETPHTVKITKGYWMGVYEVTQGQWRAITGDNPSRFKGDDNRPVENVDWDQCKNFCQSLSQQMKDGKTYRLPTEAEWEYACRAGTTTAYHSGNGEAALKQVGWYSGNSGNQTHPVGLKDKNAWGLYDMHGNVWEWCADWYGDYPNGDIKDPKGSNSGTGRVLRGGSWGNPPRYYRSASRNWSRPDRRLISLGLRVCCRLD